MESQEIDDTVIMLITIIIGNQERGEPMRKSLGCLLCYMLGYIGQIAKFDKPEYVMDKVITVINEHLSAESGDGNMGYITAERLHEFIVEIKHKLCVIFDVAPDKKHLH